MQTRPPRANPSTTLQPLAISIVAAAAKLGISRSAAYAAAHDFLVGRSGGLPCVKIRGRVIVPLKALEDFLTPTPPTQVAEVVEVRRVK